MVTLADRNITVQKSILLSEGLVLITEDMLFVGQQVVIYLCDVIYMHIHPCMQVPDSRIYILNMNSALAKIVFCQVRPS